MVDLRHYSYWQTVWQQFRQHRLGMAALAVVVFFALAGIYAPLLASSKPLVVSYDGTLYFPLFRYLLFPGFFTKWIDLFYNLLMFATPIIVLCWLSLAGRARRLALTTVGIAVVVALGLIAFRPMTDPASDPVLNAGRQQWLESALGDRSSDPLLWPIPPQADWQRDLSYMTPYAQLNEVIRYRLLRDQDQRLQKYAPDYAEYAYSRWLLREVADLRSMRRAHGDEELTHDELVGLVEKTASKEEQELAVDMPTLWAVEQQNREEQRQRLLTQIHEAEAEYPSARETLDRLTTLCRQLTSQIAELKINIEAQRVRLLVLESSASSGVELNEQLVAQQERVAEMDKQCALLVEASEQERARLAGVRRVVLQYEQAQAELNYLKEHQAWLEKQQDKIDYIVLPLLRTFHWEDDAGGEQSLNRFISWNERTRINRRDLVAGLIFGIRISLTVGLLAIGLALALGVPIGALAGYFGGTFDIIVSRLIEVWESMPTFFMLLLVVAITQSKSVFLVIATIGIFGWTGFARYLRGEFFKQRNLPYVDACHGMGFSNMRIIYRHVLPNAIPPLLTLLPFAIMGAIGSEAGLSFLGLGEEDSCSWGVLMDEGRHAFPGESYLLWPPAIVLTMLLVAIALMGDALRDAIDPKLRKD